MKLASLLIMGCCICITLQGQEKDFTKDLYGFIENPEIFELNQEPGHAPMVPYANIEDAIENDWNKSTGYQSLNGQWKFAWSETPEKAPADFFKTTFDDSKWNNIPVPSNWEMQGYGDPVFRNIAQPFKADPPRVPREYNPTGTYRKTFTVPDAWKEKEIFVHFEAITSASFVWINGQQLGYNEGANEPSEYNITKYLKPGENLLALKVLKISDGTYLEDQDFWRLAGIFRNVYLLATPKVHLHDYYITTDLDEAYRDANLKIVAELKNYSVTPVRGAKVKASIYEITGKNPVATIVSENVDLPANQSISINLSSKISNPKKWSSEYPNLYRITLELINNGNVTSEVVSDRFGFKEVEIKNQVLYCNGVAIKLNGVNSHMQHPVFGHAMDVETIRKDFTIMKQFNINCVRTSHYPPNKEYLELADEMGIFIVDETGDESHATEFVSTLPEWRNAYVERVQKMVLRDRSHPCIIFWSAGNESGFGNNICEVIKEGKRLDPTKPWMYGGNTDDVGWKYEVPCEDIIGPRYPTPYELKTRIAQVPADKDHRPSFMDEYISVEGNGGGDLDEFWELIYKYPRLSGGAIWDFVSPGLLEKVRVVKDLSPNNISVALMGRAKQVAGNSGKVIDLNGHDQWVEVYRDPELDITGNQLTLAFYLFPREWNGCGTLVNKGSYQYGIQLVNKDSIEFYLTTSKSYSLKALLPNDWLNKWHKIYACYNGSKMLLSVDNAEIGSIMAEGKIENKPFPVNVGRNCEIHRDETPGCLSNAQFDNVFISDKVIASDAVMPANAQLYLDFETVEEKGEFFSMGIGGRTYGLIWPDRTVQPELWQVKKSAQPVHTEWYNINEGTIEITNRFHFMPLSELNASWQLFADNMLIEKGNLILNTPAQTKEIVKIPFTKPVADAGKEYRILVSFQLKKPETWAPAGFELAWDQLEIPNTILASAVPKTSEGQVKTIETETELSVSGNGFVYKFSKKSGKIVSLNFNGKELVQQGPSLNVWRAPLANELDQWPVQGLSDFHAIFSKPGMGGYVASGWQALGLDNLTHKLDEFMILQLSNNEVIIKVLDHYEGSVFSTSFDNNFTYTIGANGEITVDHTVTPNGRMPLFLPRIGLQWVFNDDFQNISWYGRGPFENYPDRKTGAKIGVYSMKINEMTEPYLTPQDHGLRCDNRWVKLENAEGAGIEFSGSSLFNFSALVYDSENLSRSRYTYQLKPFNGTTFNFDYATSGVGCTAISILNKYRVMPQEYRFVTKVRPYKKLAR